MKCAAAVCAMSARQHKSAVATALEGGGELGYRIWPDEI